MHWTNHVWMCQTFLHLNKDKTEVIVFWAKEEWLTVSAQLQSVMLKTINQAGNLCVFMDSDPNFSCHTKTITQSAYYHHKNISRIRGLMSQQILKYLVHAFIFSRLVYFNGVFTGLSKSHWTVPWIKTEHGDTVFNYYAPHICNKLPVNCRSAPALTSFKSRLKIFLFAFH